MGANGMLKKSILVLFGFIVISKGRGVAQLASAHAWGA